MTLSERAACYNTAFTKYPDSRLSVHSGRWLSGTWVLGNSYKGSGLYGAYPPEYMKRISTLFPDQPHVLHLFAGSLPQSATRSLVTVDRRITPDVRPGIQADAVQLPFLDQTFHLCYSDPPYSKKDAEMYATPMPSRQKTFAEVHRVLRVGGFLVWMDVVLPMYSRDFWKWVGAITLWRSTNHRIRGVMIFERV